MVSPLAPDLKATIRRRLLAFFDGARRDLPWRGEPDPYRVWVSEVMLQQTRVEAVVPYYERWLERFPTLEALAAADRDEVLAAWAGLGYYSRARNLHDAARIVRDRLDGAIPDSAEDLRALPGVGDYTAGAVASIAFGRAEPAVDGNARRVLARLFDLPAPTAGELRRTAAELVPADRPGAFNQALMELGATLCAPRDPDCGACPLEAACLARARGTVAERPAPRPRRAVPAYHVGTAVLFSAAGRALVVRRAEDGLLGGMWEFPGEIAAEGEPPVRAANRVARRLAGVDGGPARPLDRVEHLFSHRRHTYHAFLFDVAGEAGPPIETASGWTDAAWVAPAGLHGYALPTAQRKIATALAGVAC